MVQKYENKRFYVAPTEAMREEARRMNDAALSKQPQTKPLRALLGENATKLVVGNSQVGVPFSCLGLFADDAPVLQCKAGASVAYGCNVLIFHAEICS